MDLASWALRDQANLLSSIEVKLNGSILYLLAFEGLVTPLMRNMNAAELDKTFSLDF